MNNNSYNLFICSLLVLILLFHGCDKTKEAFYEAEEIATKEAYNNFILTNPTSKYIDKAKNRIKDISFWEKINTSKTNKLYDNYLVKFPKGLYISEAEQKIKMISDLYNAESKETIEKFIKDYPNSELLSQAHYKMKDIELWEQIKAKQSIELYKNYIDSFPDGIFVSEAKETFHFLSKNPEIFIIADNSFTNEVHSVCFSPDESYVISGSSDHIIRLWCIKSGRLIKSFVGHTDHVVSVNFSPNGSHIISGSSDKTIKLWETSSGKLIKTFDEHLACVTSVCFSPDGRYILSGSLDKDIKLWDFDSGTFLKSFKGHSSRILFVGFSPDCTLIASKSFSSVKIWNVESSMCIKTFDNSSFSSLSSVNFISDGQRILAATHNEIKIWDINSGELVRSFDQNSLFLRSDPDETQIITKNVREGYAVTKDSVKLVRGHTGFILTLSLSPDGDYFITGSGDKSIVLWNVEPKPAQQVKSFLGHTDSVSCINFSPSAMYLVSGSYDKTIRIWDLKKENEIMIINLLPNSEWLVWSSDQLNYNSSQNGDKYAAIRFNKEDENYKLLKEYRKQYKGKFKPGLNRLKELEAAAAKDFMTITQETEADIDILKNFIKRYKKTTYGKQVQERMNKLSIQRFKLLNYEDDLDILRIYLKEYEGTKGESMMRKRIDEMLLKQR